MQQSQRFFWPQERSELAIDAPSQPEGSVQDSIETFQGSRAGLEAGSTQGVGARGFTFDALELSQMVVVATPK